MSTSQWCDMKSDGKSPKSFRYVEWEPWIAPIHLVYVEIFHWMNKNPLNALEEKSGDHQSQYDHPLRIMNVCTKLNSHLCSSVVEIFQSGPKQSQLFGQLVKTREELSVQRHLPLWLLHCWGCWLLLMRETTIFSTATTGCRDCVYWEKVWKTQ